MVLEEGESKRQHTLDENRLPFRKEGLGSALCIPRPACACM